MSNQMWSNNCWNGSINTLNGCNLLLGLAAISQRETTSSSNHVWDLFSMHIFLLLPSYLGSLLHTHRHFSPSLFILCNQRGNENRHPLFLTLETLLAPRPQLSYSSMTVSSITPLNMWSQQSSSSRPRGWVW